MRTKFYFRFILCSFLVILITSCNSNNKAKGAFNPNTIVDYPYYNNLTEVLEASTDVIRGTVVEDQGIKEYILEDDLGPEYTTKLPYHIYVLEVTETLKGSLAQGDKLTVKVDNIEKDKKLINDGLYFLEVYKDKAEPASLINLMQRNIPIEEDLLLLNAGSTPFFSNKHISFQNAAKEIIKLK